jgi:hypothetical protein
VNVLLVSSRFPWPPHTGDRLRATLWIEALAGVADVTLVAPPGDVPADRRVRHVELRPSPAGLAAGALRAGFGSLPFQSLLAAGFGWSDALRRAGGPFDTAVVLLARGAPWLSGRLPATRSILDAVDATSVNSAERARATRGIARTFWWIDSERMARLERSAAAQFDEVLVVSEEECSRFGPNARAIPNGVAVEPAGGTGARRFDFAFWGNLRYFANRDALELLFTTIWPAIRRRRPDATLLVAGEGASDGLLARDGREGVSVLSPLEERAAVLRTVRVALLPLRAGSGVSNKVMEGAEASCALAGTPLAFRGLHDLATGQLVEEDPERLAASCAALLEDRDRIAAMGSAARAAVAASHDRAHAMARLRDAAHGRG